VVGYRDDNADVGKPVNKYVQELETDMRNVERYVREHADNAQQQYANYYSTHAKVRLSK